MRKSKRFISISAPKTPQELSNVCVKNSERLQTLIGIGRADYIALASIDLCVIKG